nr:MAG TPA: hypothetical protein [Caudoviricetes sp.]
MVHPYYRLSDMSRFLRHVDVHSLFHTALLAFLLEEHYCQSHYESSACLTLQ